MKREWRLRCSCSHADCKEFTVYTYQTLRDMKSSVEARLYGINGNKWKCSRHNNPEQVLGLENLSIHYEIESHQKDYGRFFGSAGFIFGPGFKVWANDLPAGAKLIVDVRIEMP